MRKELKLPQARRAHVSTRDALMPLNPFRFGARIVRQCERIANDDSTGRQHLQTFASLQSSWMQSVGAAHIAYFDSNDRESLSDARKDYMPSSGSTAAPYTGTVRC